MEEGPHHQAPAEAARSLEPCSLGEVNRFDPVLQRLDALQARVETLEALLGVSPAAEVQAARSLDSSPELGRAGLVQLAAWAALTIALLACLHGVLLFALDAKPLLLRLATLTVPMVTGFLALNRRAAGVHALLGSSITVAVMSVSLMLGITALIDDVPFWPDTARDRREVMEYLFGILLGHLGGCLVPGAQRQLKSWRAAHKAGTPALAPAKRPTRTRLQRAALRIRDIAAAIAPVASCITALYTGLKAFFGL